MAVIETWYNQDLQKPVRVNYLDGSLFSHNGNGNRIGVHVFDNGEPVTLSGTVSGYVVTSDGSTVPCTGTRSGNAASILIPAAAYQPGAVFITVFLTDGSTVTTLASVATTVMTARTSNQVSPGSVVTDWTQTINAAMQSVVDANAANIALPYDSLTYPVPLGKYTLYNDLLYRCVSPIASSETWTASHWTRVKLADDVSDLKSALINDDNIYIDFTKSEMESGSWAFSAKAANSKRLRSKKLIPVYKGTVIRYTNSSLKVYFGVLETISSNSYLQSSGWIATGGNNSEYVLNYDGFLTFIVESTNDITVDDYNVIAKAICPITRKEIYYTDIADSISTWADEHYINMSQVTINEGEYIKYDGDIASNSAMSYTDYIEISESVATVTVNRNVYVDSAVYPQDYMVWWYDENKTLLGVGSQQIKVGSLLTSVKAVHWHAKYIRVNLSRYHINPFVWLGYEPELRYNGYYAGNVDAHTITDPGYYAITDSVGNTNMPKATTGLLTVKKASWDGYYEHTFVCADGVYVEYKRDDTTGWTNWFEIIDRTKLTSAIENRFGKVGSFTGAFTQTETIIAYNIILKKNTSYLIRFNNTRSGLINIYGHENTSNFKRVYAWMNGVVFTNDGTDRYLDFYNPLGQEDAIDVDVFAIGSIEEKAEKVPTVYTVKKDASTADYTSLSKCLIDLKDDHNPKVIEIWEGDYDIYAEYQELYTAGLLEKYQGTNPSMDYFNYCVWVPENTNIIGKGIVRLKWEPTKEQLETDGMTGYQTCCISPLNVAATATIENVEIYCKNGRYSLHNDGLGISQFTGAVQKYIDCYFYKYSNDIDDANNTSYGFTHTTGFGVDRSQHHIYENCSFYNEASGRAFYGHTRSVVGITLTNTMSSNITMDNCIMETNGQNAIKFGNGVNTNLQVRVRLANCYLNKRILITDEAGTANYQNQFDLTVLNCNNPTIDIIASSNPYNPKVYPSN